MSETEKRSASSKKRGLGRGLNALFEDEESAFDMDVEEKLAGKGGQRQMMGVDQLEPGSYQPRREFDEDALKELADSIAVHGVLQPLIVRPKAGFYTYEIIAGERRWRAAQQAQLHEVPVIVKDIGDDKALEIALIENLQRRDLNPIEEARGVRQLIEEFGHTQEKAAAVLGKSRSHVANMVRILNLPRKVLDYIHAGKISAGHARTLVTADDPLALAEQIISRGLSVRDAEALASQAREKSGKSTSKKAGKTAKDVDTLALEEEISGILGMKVTIEVTGGAGAGVVKIGFKNLDQLDEVIHRLSVNSIQKTVSSL